MKDERNKENEVPSAPMQNKFKKNRSKRPSMILDENTTRDEAADQKQDELAKQNL